MDSNDSFEIRDDVSSITSFELVRIASPWNEALTTVSTIAASISTSTEKAAEATTVSLSESSPIPPPKLRIWKDILHPWLFYARAVLTDSWWPEFAALAFSFGCLAETTITLRYYNGYPVSRLPLGLTLNTMLALLAAGSKSSLMFAVAATMSQCKWCWLRSDCGRRKRLEHLQVIDEAREASRGPLGSLLLLLGHTISTLLYLGAIITVLGIGYEPFIQQVVTYPVQHSNSTYSNATTTMSLGIDPSTLSESMSGHVLAGIVPGIYGSSFPDITPYCSTGNCTWDPFWSVD